MGEPALVDHVNEVALAELAVKLAPCPRHTRLGPVIDMGPGTGRLMVTGNVCVKLPSSRFAVTMSVPPPPALVEILAVGELVLEGPLQPLG